MQSASELCQNWSSPWSPGQSQAQTVAEDIWPKTHGKFTNGAENNSSEQFNDNTPKEGQVACWAFLGIVMLADAANIVIFLDKASEQNKLNNNTACTVIASGLPLLKQIRLPQMVVVWIGQMRQCHWIVSFRRPMTMPRRCKGHAGADKCWKANDLAMLINAWCDLQCLFWCNVFNAWCDALNGHWIIQSHDVARRWTEPTFYRFLHINCLQTWGQNEPTIHVQTVNLIILHKA